MQLINKNTDYAIRLLIFIAKDEDNEESISSREISKRLDIPLQFTRSLLARLTRNKWISSREGKYGGFKLEVNPSFITLKEVIKLFQGEILLNKCMQKKEKCPNREACVVREKIKKIEKMVISEFDKITIHQLAIKSKK